MGEINVGASCAQPGVRRTKKLSTRVDLTPMVDLGFLLITFFIFSTTMSEPTAMKLVVPKDTTTDSTNVAESKTLNIVIDGNNKAHYYTGKETGSMQTVETDGSAIRHIIIAKKQELSQRFGKGNHLILLLKPTENASYESIVNILDEVTINDVKHYFLTEPVKEELARLPIPGQTQFIQQ